MKFLFVHNYIVSITCFTWCVMLVIPQIVGMDGWYLANVDVNKSLNVFPSSAAFSFVNNSVVSVDFVGEQNEQNVVYFGAPEYYLGE